MLALPEQATEPPVTLARRHCPPASRHLRRPPKLEELLDDRWLRGLHEDMFGEVWEWAGRYRTTTTNLGIEWHQIPVAVRNLVDDAAEWIQTGRPTDQAAVGLHHRLAAIHPFVNGNGRHARLTADVFAAADAGDLDPLVAFARS